MKWQRESWTEVPAFRFPDLHNPLSTEFSRCLILKFYFPNAITSLQSHQNAQSFFRVLICLKKLTVGRKEEKNFKIR